MSMETSNVMTCTAGSGPVVVGAPVVKSKPIVGYEAIRQAVGKRLQQSVSLSTAKRWAEAGRSLRLPVFIYGNGRAYMLVEHLEVFATAWLMLRPSGARLPGVMKRREPS